MCSRGYGNGYTLKDPAKALFTSKLCNSYQQDKRDRPMENKLVHDPII